MKQFKIFIASADRLEAMANAWLIAKGETIDVISWELNLPLPDASVYDVMTIFYEEVPEKQKPIGFGNL